MARTISFTKEILMKKSVEYIKKYGYSKLTVRNLAQYCECSTQPIFRIFNNMDEYKLELKKYLHDYYDDFIYKIVDKNDYLFTISYAYALFAYKEANIFKSLFMEDLSGSRTIDEVLSSSWNIETIESIPKQYKITQARAKELYRDVRFYTHGLACQIAINSIIVDEQEIKNLIKNIIEKINKGE